MAGKSSTVRVAIVGDNSSLNRSLRDSQSKLSKFGRAIGKAAIAGGLFVGAAAAYAAVNFAEAAIEDQKAAALLADALRKATGATDAQIASTEEWISQQGVLLGVTDDELRPALARLAGATGDIGEAQELASLAMDVSAARGKDLGTVTEALAKAQQGNLSGLSRLGVATKDAEGKTKSLKEITEDLARLYGGAAAKNADTAAGKFERVKLQLDEMKEDIGAKLLPVLTEFGDWLLKTGIPAAQNMADAIKRRLGPMVRDLRGWVKDNKKELKDLGEQILDTVIPAVEKLGGFVGDLVKFFAGLPGPVKKAGIEVGIAAVAWVKLNSALKLTNLGTMIAGLGTAKTATKAAGDEAVVTSTKMGKLQTAARNVSGAAGLGLLIDSTQRTDGAVSTLESTLGGAAIGFSVGGPWGAAIGGLGGLVAGVAKSVIDGKSDFDTFREAIEKPVVADIDSSAVEDLLGLLAKAHGNYKLIAADAAAQAAENAAGGPEKLLEVTAVTGLRKDTISSAFAGDPQALKLVNEQVATLNTHLDAGVAILDDFNEGTGKAGKLLPVVGGDTIALADAVDLGTKSVTDLQGAFDAGLISASQLAEGQKLYNDALADGAFTAQEYGDIQQYNDRVQKSVTANSETQAAALQTLTDITGSATAAQTLLNQHNQEGATILGVTIAQLKNFPKKVQTDIALNGAPETNQQAIDLLGKFGKFLKFKDIRTVISAPGIDLTRGQIEKLAKQAKLTPKQIKTLFKLEGVKTVTKGADDVKTKVKGAGDVKPDFTRFKTGTNKFFNDMGPIATAGGEKVGRGAKEGLKKGAKVDLDPFRRGIQTGMNQAKTTASTGASEVGTSAKTGFAGGFAGAIASWSSQVRAAVAAAIAAGKAEAKAHSPSKETEKTGRDMAEGYVVGSKKGEKDVEKAGTSLVQAWFRGAGAAGGLESINAALERATGFITKTLDKQLKAQQKAIKEQFGKGQEKEQEKALAKLEKRWNKHGKAVTKALKDEYAALRANGKAQDDNQAKLDTATEAYTSYSNAVRDSIIASGDITQLGRRDNGTVSLGGLLAQLRKRAKDAQEFSALLQQLAAQGLNAAQIAQLTSAGPEQALATARAIAKGGQAAVDEINQLSVSLATTGSTLGDALANQFSIAGTNAAKALIKGLQDQQGDLDKAARQMAAALVKEVKKQLGIKSPSKVFKQIGDQSTKGLVLGLDQVYVAKGGKTTADTLVTSTSGTSTPGPTTDKRMEGVGVSARAGLAQGAVADMTDIVNSGTALAQSLINAVKAALGSKSPSKEFKKIGAEVTEGLALGLDDVYVAKAGAGLAKSLTTGFGQPQLSTNAVMGRDKGFTVGVTLNAQQVSQLERGRSVQLDLDAYRAAGGRSRA